MHSPLRWSLAFLLTSAFALPAVVLAQEPAQVVITAESKSPVDLTPADLSVELNGHNAPVLKVAPLTPDMTQVVLLIDDGLRTSIGRQLGDIEQFINGLPAGTEIMIGYMQNGRVVTAQPFTTEHSAAAATVRLPFSSPGLSASPYICLSDFVTHWPRETEAYGKPQAGPPIKKKRFVLMITNGVDPYNGSVSPLNQDSPYVQKAVTDAQRANVVVSSIYYGDSGIRGGAANFSGQNYLNQIAEATGGISYYQMNFNPVSLAPYFKQFQNSLNQSFVLTVDAPSGKDRVLFRVKAKQRGVKLHAPGMFHPGSVESEVAGS